MPKETQKSRTTVLEAPSQLKPNNPRKEFGATSSPESDEQRVPFGAVFIVSISLYATCSFWSYHAQKGTRHLVLQAAPKHKPNSPKKEFDATSSPDSDTQRAPFGPHMGTKEHTSWCQKKPKNHGPQCYKQPHNWSQTAPERNLVLQAAPLATKNVFRLALTRAQENTPVGTRRSTKITDQGGIDESMPHPGQRWIVKLPGRIVKLPGRILKFGLWNLPHGLWNWYCETWKLDSETWNSDCETLKLDCETLETDCETLGADCETRIVQLWKRIVKLWGRIVKLGLYNLEGRLWNSGDGETEIVKLWRRIVKIWGVICETGVVKVCREMANL